MTNIYGQDFYKDRHQKTVHSARTVLSLVLDVLPPLYSAVDFGCGVGTWLSVLREKGVVEVRGLDGPWVDQSLLKIPRENFGISDFTKVIQFDKKYGLAISLEVAEHLPSELAGVFVDSLTNAANFVLFSAAIPFQGGLGHVNKQWPDYWVNLFAARGYVALDCVRRRIWDDKDISVWYRQNILLFVNKNEVKSLINYGATELENHLPFSLVHPDLYLLKMQHVSSGSSVRGSWQMILEALKIYLKRKISDTGILRGG
jgi:hypothetical protein